MLDARDRQTDQTDQAGDQVAKGRYCSRSIVWGTGTRAGIGRELGNEGKPRYPGRRDLPMAADLNGLGWWSEAGEWTVSGR